MFVITPLMLYFIAFPDTFQAKGGFWQQYTRDYIGSGLVWSATGPLWFVEVLLGFSLILALLVETARHLPRKGPPRSEPDGEPSLLFFASVIVAVAAATFIIRLFRPIGTRFANFQVCFFASYIALFLLGVRSAKKRWFARAAAAGNRIWFAAALGIGIPAWIAIILLGGLLDGNIAKLLGGWTLQSAFYSLWEAFVALSMCIGLCALFANQRRRRETVSFFFSRNSFSVFVFHPVFMLALTRYFAAWKLAPLPKALFLGLTTYGLSLLFAEFVVRKIPVIKNLL
jgi:surface polysaccharide O-acyltransferase-like enzyme